MKSANKSLMTFGLIAATGLAFTSCNKTVSPRKLDGTWKVASGSETYMYESDFQEINTTTTCNGTVEIETGETEFTDGEEMMVEWTSETNFVYTEDSDYNFSSKTTTMWTLTEE